MAAITECQVKLKKMPCLQNVKSHNYLTMGGYLSLEYLKMSRC